jgi:UDP-N-acetylmuramate--alanine ligase
MNITDAQRIHFIGIGGIGMSALARFFLHEKKQVSGSDRASSAITTALETEGVMFYSAQTASNITPDIQMVVYTEAMAHDHPEMVAAQSLGVPMMNYFDALGLVANEYYLIAVAGSHGKTTTTAMIADILEAADLDPTVIVGSLRSKTQSNFRAGKSKYAVVEACEYKRDFLSLQPDVLVITNIEYEHVDYYKNLADVEDAFHTLALRVPATGAIIAATADVSVAAVLEGVSATVIDYRPQIDLSLPLRQPGIHNRMNAAAAASVAAFIGVSPDVAAQALSSFAGTWRRFEYKGEVQGVPVYDDYGHHPTELRMAFAGTRELYPQHQLTVVFQSHTYSRTQELFTDFVEVLASVDKVYLLPIYAAREENVTGITSEQLMLAVNKKGGNAIVAATVEACTEMVRVSIVPGVPTVVVVIGAGPVTEVARLLTKPI